MQSGLMVFFIVLAVVVLVCAVAVAREVARDGLGRRPGPLSRPEELDPWSPDHVSRVYR